MADKFHLKSSASPDVSVAAPFAHATRQWSEGGVLRNGGSACLAVAAHILKQKTEGMNEKADNCTSERHGNRRPAVGWGRGFGFAVDAGHFRGCRNHAGRRGPAR